MKLAVSGHRPPGLGIGYDEVSRRRLIEFAKKQVAILEPDVVLQGGALGWDQACAFACIEVGLPFELAQPFPAQASKWPIESQRLYEKMMAKASKVHTISQSYSMNAMYKRNCFMVDNYDHVLFLYNGIPSGGTHQAYLYAQKVGKAHSNCWEGWRTWTT
jgi:uncharacterized phage-like protein YoqJ